MSKKTPQAIFDKTHKEKTMQKTQTISFEEIPFGKTHLRIGLGGIGGQFCDGFILGIIGITMLLAQKSLGLTSWWLGAIGAASLLGLFFGSLIMGVVADKIGRKPIFVWTMPFFVLSLWHNFL